MMFVDHREMDSNLNIDDDDDDDMRATDGQIMLDNTTVGTFQLAGLSSQPPQTNVTTADRFQGARLIHPSVQQNVATPQPLQLSHVSLHSLQLENIIIDETRINFIKPEDFT
ncbi:unnamed protein product [Rotaria sp. Silwood2]|nr:unnamed protein product [Rotaria sp. Silwood2]